MEWRVKPYVSVVVCACFCGVVCGVCCCFVVLCCVVLWCGVVCCVLCLLFLFLLFLLFLWFLLLCCCCVVVVLLLCCCCVVVVGRVVDVSCSIHTVHQRETMTLITRSVSSLCTQSSDLPNCWHHAKRTVQGSCTTPSYPNCWTSFHPEASKYTN